MLELADKDIKVVIIKIFQMLKSFLYFSTEDTKQTHTEPVEIKIKICKMKNIMNQTKNRLNTLKN